MEAAGADETAALVTASTGATAAASEVRPLVASVTVVGASVARPWVAGVAVVAASSVEASTGALTARGAVRPCGQLLRSSARPTSRSLRVVSGHAVNNLLVLRDGANRSGSARERLGVEVGGGGEVGNR